MIQRRNGAVRPRFARLFQAQALAPVAISDEDPFDVECRVFHRHVVYATFSYLYANHIDSLESRGLEVVLSGSHQARLPSTPEGGVDE